MGVKCVLLYKLPKGAIPVQKDVERIVTALTQQLYCLPESAGRSLRDAPAASDKVLEASVSIFKQQQASDPSVIKEPKSLQDVWLFKLHREAPTKAYLLLKHIESSNAFRVTEAEPSIRTFLEKRLDYKHKGAIFIQSQSWTMGDKSSDVTVKLLTLLQQGSQAPKVLALEVGYGPACLLDSAAPLLQELADKIISSVGPPTGTGPGQSGTLVLLQPKYHKPHKLDATAEGGLFGEVHLVEMYTELITEGLAGGR